MSWGTDLWDQHEVIEKHTHNGLDLVERYVKFVKERTEIEQSYAKQLRSLCKKYSRRGGKEDQDSKFTSQQAFQDVVNELNDYAGQREVLAENMTLNICVELTRQLHEIKQERKTYLSDVKKAQQTLESSLKQLESSKKRFEKEWKEAEKANQQAERAEQDTNSTKADVDKARQQAHLRTHTADECKNDYASQLQKYNKEQNLFYHIEIPALLNKLQDLDERRIRKLAEGYALLAETERKVMPIIGKCLDGISTAGSNTNENQDSLALVELYKTGLERPADVEFEDCSQATKPAMVENTHGLPKVRIRNIFKGTRGKVQAAEDFSHLPPEQRKKQLQSKIDDISKELQVETDQSEALSKMRSVYEKNSQLGNPASLEPQITQTTHSIARLKGELAKYEVWLGEAGGIGENLINNNTQNSSLFAPKSGTTSLTQPADDDVYEYGFDEFDDDTELPIGQCSALYNFDGASEGTVSLQVGELLSIMEDDQGDGWTRVRRANGDEGYVPASYVKPS